jgi:hypothetical protein
MTHTMTPLPFPPMRYGVIHHDDATTGYHPLTAEQICSVRSRTMFSAHDTEDHLGVWIVAWHEDHDWLVTWTDHQGTHQLPMSELTDAHTAGLVFRPISCGRTPRAAGPKPRP